MLSQRIVIKNLRYTLSTTHQCAAASLKLSLSMFSSVSSGAAAFY